MRITKNPLNPTESAFSIDLLTRNRGSRPGVVENVGVILTGPNGGTVFGAHLTMFDRVLNVGEQLPPPEMAPFTGFELGKGQAATTRILLRPRSPDFEWEEGDYQGEVMMLTSAKDGWAQGPGFSFVVDSEDIDELESIRAVPQPDGRLFVNWKTRDKLIGTVQRQLEDLERLL